MSSEQLLKQMLATDFGRSNFNATNLLLNLQLNKFLNGRFGSRCGEKSINGLPQPKTMNEPSTESVKPEVVDDTVSQELDFSLPLDFSLKKKAKHSASPDPNENPTSTNLTLINNSQSCSTTLESAMGHSELKCLLEPKGASAFNPVPQRNNEDNFAESIPDRKVGLDHTSSLSHLQMNLLNANAISFATVNGTKNVRPFKAYDPTNPASVLQVPMDTGVTTFATEATGLHGRSLSDVGLNALILAAQYRSLLGKPELVIPRNVVQQKSRKSPQMDQFKVTSSEASSQRSEVTSTMRNRSGNDRSNGQSVPIFNRASSNSPTSTVDLIPKFPPITGGDSGHHSDEGSPECRRPESVISNNDSQGHASGTRRKGKSLPDDLKDDAYWERRRKNNDAAKRSRDARRVKEDEIALRAALLEQENMKLRIELASLKTECEKLRHMVFN